MPPTLTENADELARRYGMEPTPPSVQRLTKLVSQQDASLEIIAEIISKDKMLTSRLLRAMNPRAEDESEYVVDTIEAALMRGGVGAVLLLAMGDPLMLAVAKTCSAMLGTKAEVLNPRKTAPLCGEHIVGIIGFSGKAVGSVRLRFSIETANWIVCTLLGMPADSTLERAEMDDVLGEMANIITGNFKSNICIIFFSYRCRRLYSRNFNGI